MNAIVRAPEIDRPGLVWFNVEQPLSLGDLRGRVVILDFWTSCCINCMHLLPILRRIEDSFPDEVVVIGVHSPKFQAEQDAGNLAQAIARYDIRHPVVHDPEFRIWNEYAVRAWPTLVFIGPDGRIIGQNAGEPDAELLQQAVADALAQYRQSGVLSPAPLALSLQPIYGGRFSFPGKIKPLTLKHDKLWALADGGHHQIAVLDDNGRELARYGSGAPGFADGSTDTARFNAPQGLICGEDAEGGIIIYVADTGNHAIRRIDRATGRVTTLAGTGRRGGALGEPQDGFDTALASPWDLELDGDRLFFANAGSHQLGVLDLRTGEVRVFAGTGGESIVDGPGPEAQLAQPSGLTLNGPRDRLYFADSETSSIRMVALSRATRVTTLVGAGLFEFGHKNGPYESARLQHPLGLTWVATGGAGRLIVADSYNGALRVLELDHRQVRDFDTGYECTDDLCIPFSEPAGVWADGPNRILMVDTNNHRIIEYRASEGTYGTWAR